MRVLLVLLLCFGSLISSAQHLADSNIKIEDESGHLITDPIKRSAFLKRKQRENDSISKVYSRSSLAQVMVPLCSNGSFEEFETVGASNILKNFTYAIGNPDNPTQCKSVSNIANQGVKQYDPNDMDVMASTVPANYLDEYIGNINGYDQYCLKINYKHTYLSTLGLIQAKRFKTDNETRLKFNYKVVLQSIFDNDHDNEQPYFKVRVVNQSGNVVSEMCVIGDAQNCIFKQAPNMEAGSVVLYTPNWQSGILDISSIPNNEEFTVEFITARCGLGGHFGYGYVDDICLSHSSENLQGSIELDPLFKNCPTFPFSVCGSFTVPNSGGISATVSSIVLNVNDATNTVVYTSSAPTLDMPNKRFCFDIQATNLTATPTDYNVSVSINYGLLQTNCSGTNFTTASSDDANPGWDISFLNCTNCDVDVHTASLFHCDANHDGKEFFNLTNLEPLIIANTAGLTFAYFTSLDDATNATNSITATTNYESRSATIFVRVTKDAACYKIIAVSLVVKNPSASITGILNVCSGSTVLTASPGASYLWFNGQTTQSITVTATGTYTVTVTDAFGCQALATVTILNNLVAVQPTIVVTQPTCFVSTGTIAITSPASQYSYDNGLTWSTDASRSNLPLGTYKIIIKTAAGCTSYNTTIELVPFLLSFPDFTAVHPQYCGDLGSITITTNAVEYSFDDGLTWGTTNTMSGLPSGTHLIRVKDAFGCISNANSVILNGEFLADPLYTVQDPYCGNPGSITITTPAAQYSFDGGTNWQTSSTMGNLPIGNTLIKIKNAQGCTSSNVYVYLRNFEYTYPTYILNDAGCGVYASITITTPGNAYSFDDGATWSTDPTKLNLSTGVTYKLKVRRGATCVTYTNYVTVYSSYYPIPAPTDFAVTLCDAFNDGSENIDLTQYAPNLIANAANFTFLYYKTLNGAQNAVYAEQIQNENSCNLSNSNNTVYVRVISDHNCYNVAKLLFTFIDSPRIYMVDKYPLCQFRNVVIDAHPGYDRYLWSTGESTQTITVTQPGSYWVTVFENHGALICDTRKDFFVYLSNPANIIRINTSDWSVDDNSITVTVAGLGDYVYSIDGENYQEENVFSHLKSGDYTVFVKDKNGCGIVDEDVFLLMYPTFFTPNDDTYNDLWKIKLSEYEPGFRIKIFDRNGKLLKELGNDAGWDGTFNNIPLPSSDYWFVVTRGDGKEFRGHFSLKR